MKKKVDNSPKLIVEVFLMDSQRHYFLKGTNPFGWTNGFSPVWTMVKDEAMKLTEKKATGLMKYFGFKTFRTFPA